MEERAREIGRALQEAGLEYRVRIVKDKEMKERVCLEVERLGLCGLVMGRGRRKLGSVSGYCIKHCVCPVVVVRDDEAGELGPVPEEEEEEAAAKV
ncbi:hypothetical protein MLD38_033384 [Melastoma candidum]|uniref:Uncharacterized protein n=1 Tax=Melastoma candidum TaxID=119954 RepID=A0ACB9MAB9_9MYRT|nr:hypothetical protein MLD38_033384 [Melastoma candidum]